MADVGTWQGRVPYAPIPGVTVIGLGHKARQGKDLTASMIIDRLGSKALRIGFADALYAVARVEHGMTTKDAPLLQRLGTEVYRQRDPEIWVRTVYYTLLDKRPPVAVLTDVRFPNEAQFVKDLGGTLIKVERFTEDGTTPHRDPSRSLTHPSETSLDDYAGWDITIQNTTGKMDLLEDSVDRLLEGLKLI